MSILPLLPPPSPTPPSLSLPPRPPSLSQPFPTAPEWRVSTHIFPAAYPRSRIGSSADKLYSQVSEKKERGGRMSKPELERKTKELFEKQEEAGLRSRESVEGVKEVELWIAVNRYYRVMEGGRGKGGGVTVVACHATGLHKETWEVALSSLVAGEGGELVEEIWALDSVHQGDSAILNEGRIGEVSDWVDFGRDAANFVAHYLPPLASSPPYQLPFLPLSPSFFNLTTSPPNSLSPIFHRSRKIVGLGHSLGAASISFAASLLPSLFHSLLLVDVVMFGPKSKDSDKWIPILAIAKGSLSRKDFWTSREEARSEFGKKKEFYGKWDKGVLDRFVEFGLRKTRGGVGLRCPKDWEAMVFADPKRRGSYACFQRLHLLPPHLSVHWMFAGINPILDPLGQAELLETTRHCVRVTKTVVEGSGHLITQEMPVVVGGIMGRLLREKVGRGEKAKL